MAIDRKYGRVEIERGSIADDEPVVVFRAQDATLPRLLHFYEGLCISAGSPESHVHLIVEDLRAVQNWQLMHGIQVPGTPGRYTLQRDGEDTGNVQRDGENTGNVQEEGRHS
jgi:hypothetical protein